MEQRSHAAVAIALAISVALSSCGSGGGDSTSKASGPELTRAAFVAKANRICRQATAQSPAFPGKKSGAGLQTSTHKVLPYLNKVVHIGTSNLHSLEKLNPPAAMRADFDALIQAQKDRLFDLLQAAQSATDGDAQGFTTAFQNDQQQDRPKYVRIAKRLGLTDCARSG